MNDPSTPEENSALRHIRTLIWVYLVLLLIEGALRKWVLPQLSNPLLVVRDPVVLAIYVLAIRARVFPKNGWILALGIIGVLSVLLSYVVLWPYLRPSRITLVAGFGFRSNFLHLPLIWVMAKVLRPQDVKRIGWWCLAIAVPMAVIMVAQFRSAPDSFLNRTAGGEGEMMLSALGKVRTAGTFSFVIGVVAFFALAAGFLIWGALRANVYPKWLLFAAGGALVIGTAVSGSRSVVGAVAVVVATVGVVLVLNARAVNRFGQTLIVTLVLGFLVTQVPVFKEGLNVLTTRFNEVAEASETSVGRGLIERVISDYKEGFFVLTKAPFLGYGLGIGTNAGAKFLTGRMTFLLSEGEWPRIFLESGPVLGLAYVVWRCAVAVMVGILCVRAVRAGNVLPALLFSSSFMPLISGQFGQPTVLGFAVFATGLAVAALKVTETEGDEGRGAPPVQPPVRRVARRSAYAERLHSGVPTERPANAR
jgi:hypothetical protein